jgi:NADPH:quinone reductase-like Zn-dependent oxidoreductase
MTGAILPGDSTVEPRRLDIPMPGHGEVLIRTKAVTICGSDIRCIYRYLANLRAAVTSPLTDADMKAIAAIDRSCRLVEGQVLLWREGQSWEDLWDIDGRIAR